MEESEKVNYCKSKGALSICTAGVDWADCAFAVEHTYMPKCRFRRGFNDIAHCSCEAAQDDARGVVS